MYPIKKLILFFEKFNNKLNEARIINNEARSNIKIEDIGRNINLIPKKILMRDQKPFSNNDDDFNIIFNLHPTDGTHWDIAIRRESGKTHYFDYFGVGLDHYT